MHPLLASSRRQGRTYSDDCVQKEDGGEMVPGRVGEWAARRSRAQGRMDPLTELLQRDTNKGSCRVELLK